MIGILIVLFMALYFVIVGFIIVLVYDSSLYVRLDGLFLQFVDVGFVVQCLSLVFIVDCSGRFVGLV